jgi:predicted membrane-bound mannosyltransferase
MVQEARQTEPAALFISIETVLYLAIGLVALGLRAFALGAAPLSELEAQQIMMAWRSLGNTTISPIVMGSVALSLNLFGPSEATARLMPMVAGMALVFMPLAFRRTTGRSPAILISAFLAISPVAVASSRQVGGTAMAALCLLGMLAFLVHPRRPRAMLFAGICLGLSLACDFSALLGLLTIGLGLAFAIATDDQDGIFREAWQDWRSGFRLTQLVLGIIGAVAIGGTLFYFYPPGFGAVADHLARFASGILQREPGMPALSAVIGLYEPLIVVFGLIGAWLASQSNEPWQRFVSGWSVMAVLVMLIYPGSRPPHALWTILPLSTLAALTVQMLLISPRSGQPKERWGLGITIFLISTMALANLTRHIREPHMVTFEEFGLSFTVSMELVLFIMFVILIQVVWLIFSTQLSPPHAWGGAGIAVMLLGILATISHAASLATARATDPHELWNVLPAQRETALMIETAEEVSRMTEGAPHEVGIVVQGHPNGMIGWALRDFENVTFVEAVSPNVTAPMVITPADTRNPTLGSDYVGQDFAVARAWTPTWADANQFLLWLIYREGATPPEEYRFILWIQEDIYRLLPNELQRIELEAES